MRAAEKAQRLLEDKAGFYDDSDLGFCLARVDDVTRYGLFAGYFKPVYLASVSLYPAPAEIKKLVKRGLICKAYDGQEVIFTGEKSPIGGVITRCTNIGTYKISFPSIKKNFRVNFRYSTGLNTNEIQPLPSLPAPSNRQLRKAGRALTDDEEPKLAVIKNVYSFRGLGLTFLHNAFSFLYRIPEGISPRDLIKIPESALEYWTTCVCRTRFLKLIDQNSPTFSF